MQEARRTYPLASPAPAVDAEITTPADVAKTNATVSLKRQRALQREIRSDLIISLMSKLPDLVSSGCIETVAMHTVAFRLGCLGLEIGAAADTIA